jgi:hypothetical protein
MFNVFDRAQPIYSVVLSALLPPNTLGFCWKYYRISLYLGYFLIHRISKRVVLKTLPSADMVLSSEPLTTNVLLPESGFVCSTLDHPQSWTKQAINLTFLRCARYGYSWFGKAFAASWYSRKFWRMMISSSVSSARRLVNISETVRAIAFELKKLDRNHLRLFTLTGGS